MSPTEYRAMTYAGNHSFDLGKHHKHPSGLCETVISADYDVESHTTRLGFARGLHDVDWFAVGNDWECAE